MRVDKAGQNGAATAVDHFRAVRYGKVRRDLHNTVAFHQQINGMEDCFGIYDQMRDVFEYQHAFTPLKTNQARPEKKAMD